MSKSNERPGQSPTTNTPAAQDAAERSSHPASCATRRQHTIPGSILSHPIDDHEDGDDKEFDLGGEAGTAYLDEDDDLEPEKINHADADSGTDDEDREDRFDWSDIDPEAPAFNPDGWDDENDPAFADLDPNFLPHTGESRPVRTGGRRTRLAHC